jgi:DNA-binding transcriptional MocR family regulator
LITNQTWARPARRVGVRELLPLLTGWADRPGPGYAALAERLRLLVLDGRLPVDAVLPSERDLATALATSRTTTAAAYRALRESGFAAAGQGAGTWTTLPGGRTGGGAEVPWPVQTTGLSGTADGRGDLASAAPEAPPQVHGAYAAALAELPRYLPGHGYVTAGLPALRDRVAARFAARGLPTSADQVLVTAGAVHGLRLVLEATIAPGDRVLVESPSYPLALDAVRRAGGRPVTLPVEGGGWDVASALDAVRRTGARAAYLMPDFHNPTGLLMDAPTRQSLAAGLAGAGCTAIVDETTVELDLRGPGAAPTPAPFAAFAPPGAVVTLGSASKTFWGGLRVGWVRADTRLVERLTLARALDDLGSPIVEQLATAHLLDVVGEVLAGRRPALAARAAALRAAVAEHLPGWVAPMPAGGLFLWCRLPTRASSALAAAARSAGVVLTPGPRFGAGGAFEARIRLPFSRPAGELRAAAALLGPVWRGLTGEVTAPADDVLVV